MTIAAETMQYACAAGACDAIRPITRLHWATGSLALVRKKFIKI